MDYEIVLPMKPRVILEDGVKGTYEIGGIYAGYGYTLGNALRRIILSSLPGAAITTVKIQGVNHEFSTLPGVKEDAITILLNLKRIRFKLTGDKPQKVTLSVKGQRKVVAGDFKVPSQLVILNKDQEVATLADKKSKIDIEITVEKGLGYVPREVLKKEKMETGILLLDVLFAPVRRVNYEVENMRVGERTDFNRLRFFIETDGSITPREALEESIKTLIKQLSAIIGMTEKETEEMVEETRLKQKELEESRKAKQRVYSKEEAVLEKNLESRLAAKKEESEEFLKTRIEDMDFSSRTMNALSKAGIRTIGGLARKKEEDLLKINGLGDKALNEIRRALGNFGLILK